MNDTSYYLTLTEVTQSIHLSEQALITIVDYGIVQPRGRRPADWRFDPPMVTTLRKACRLQRDLELDWAGTALALELLEQVQALREDNQRLQRLLQRLTNT